MVTLCIFLFVAHNQAHAQDGSTKTYFIKINPQGTYLRTDSGSGDSAASPSSFNLIQLMTDPMILLKEGDLIGLTLIGGFSYGNGITDGNQSLLGVFVGNSGFLYPGPKSTVTPKVSLPTCPRNIPTDIPQDFSVWSGAGVYAQVPNEFSTGSLYLKLTF